MNYKYENNVKVPKYSCGSDDITFCGNECDNKKCFRHKDNRIHKLLPYSVSYLKDSALCPSYIDEVKENE